ncbi:MAG TPA: multifunctional oxoglutarate decarboxylase/oxoglutarate dehydrogenase thiamine pyrophosphate-binding subunit/dihydrolipoyllysine-residue succinyltransferase subunit, partial [Acidimicrobiales bacterium]|nr:multifunctional oxoglutarate decarboxylase/oxoglutarate dehydrogenase thiamine pyrophosphate-binding subunit/dihydrolipoyllysine-residue succinyltransferase subunit [Acidimicrobiales bacterium]
MPGTSFGPNEWLVEEMYDRFREDPESVGPSWRAFFANYRQASAPPRSVAAQTAEAPATPSPGAPAATTAPADGRDGDRPQPLKGAAARIVANMEASLAVPTATSVRRVPAKLLEINRTILNNHLARRRGGKVSFTHLIGFAVVQALREVPVMNSAFRVDADGKPAVTHYSHVNLGLAVDVENADGSRSLVVPAIKGAEDMDFHGFWTAYEDLIRKVRTKKLSADDLAGTTVSLTNPGTIGTEHSVPRLMPGQGVIVGVGALEYPAEYSAADPSVTAQLGLSKVLTLTSTYDHRIIQGAESGLFLARVHEFLIGEHGFYDDVFESMGVPYAAVKWQRDSQALGEEQLRAAKQVHVQTIINMYRVRGHLIADLDPLEAKRPVLYAELDPSTYGLTIWDNDREFFCDGLAGRDVMKFGDVLHILRDAYCRTVGVEYMHIQEPDQKRWIQQHVEGVSTVPSADEQRHILSRLNAAEAFEKFLGTRYIGQKRFGLEGAESAIVVLDAILDAAAVAGVHEAVLGMGHRGRLNALINIVGKNYEEVFAEFEHIDPASVQGSGDVKYHLGATGKFIGSSGVPLPITVASNPSHLEAVDPVVEGMVRAKQDAYDEGLLYPVLGVLVHGDAAFAGQGVVAETLNLSALRGYGTGGTVHVVINNQLGFTTNPESARSSVYATDVAKMVQAPIFHVNGDDPEACARVGRLAFAFREAFHKDVVIDMVCYRLHGHNEGDDPSFTQPLMYERIKNHRPVRLIYTEALVKRGDLTIDEAEKAMDDFNARLQAALEETRSSASPRPTSLPAPAPALPVAAVETAVDRAVLDRVATALRTYPAGFTVHPKLERIFANRERAYAQGTVDWPLAEAMAYGTVMLDHIDVRLTGQDTRRGTFSHRNSTLVDYKTGAEYVPLAHLADDQGRFFCYDSLLSEYAALGFEYGYSVVANGSLVLWEAQFGDFFNGAQIIIDQFIVAAEEKWGQSSGLVLLLPHGYEGQGAEHSSARLERWLQSAAAGNIEVVNATTAAQFFHLVRRQALSAVRKPLVVMTPKSGLRLREYQSKVEELTTGAFHEVLDDPSADPATVRRVLLCSGKFAYRLLERRTPAEAVVRVEQLYPWPADGLADVLSRYERADEVVWVQEEPENMGAWSFVHGRLHALLRDDFRLGHVARAEAGSPAAGSSTFHEL